MTASKKLNGIIVPLITPFDDNGDLSPERAGALIERQIEVGVQGFYVGGSSGEGLLQSIAERCEYLRYVSAVNKGRTALIAQVGALSSRDAWLLADFAAENGYDVVSSTPPFYFNYSEHEVITYYKELAERSTLPVLLYNIPGTTGRNLSIETQVELLRHPNVIGSKHTETNFYNAERLMHKVEGALIFNGPDEMLTAGLAMGMAGGIGSTYNLMPRLYLDIYQSMRNNELEKARSSQRIANDVIYELLNISPGVVPGIKLGLKTLGYDVGCSRKPFQPIVADTRRFEQLLLECDGL
ncbi:MAG: dihydrodipicolinate synthase family protein [Pseudomonadales bacterium]